MGVAKPQIEAGKLRPLLALDPPKEFGLPASLPDLDSLYGKDFPDIEIPVYLYVPAKTPDYIVQTLEKAFEKMSKDPEFIADCRKMNVMSNFMPGKIAAEKMKKKMGLMKAIIADQPKTK
jgi:tripartite-type tricarboxylate transporter receptor subunit TctC